jgi:myo-inositol-1(or 4)-monophosphatase
MTDHGNGRPIALPRARDGRSAEQVARACAGLAGEMQRAAYQQDRPVEVKGRGNVVTETDVRIERAVAGLLADAFPEHALLAEETASGTPLDGWLWIVDPIDGTRNFASGIPGFCFTLALAHDGVPLLGLTLDPLRDELFFAVRGGQLTLNGRAASVSATPTVAQSLIGIDLGYDDALGKKQLAFAHWLFPAVQSVRTPGCCALGLAYAAVGRYDAFSHPWAYPWDRAAGLVLIEAGGGRVTTHDGTAPELQLQTLIAGGAAAQADYLRLWRQFAAERA